MRSHTDTATTAKAQLPNACRTTYRSLMRATDAAAVCMGIAIASESPPAAWPLPSPVVLLSSAVVSVPPPALAAAAAVPAPALAPAPESCGATPCGATSTSTLGWVRVLPTCRMPRQTVQTATGRHRHPQASTGIHMHIPTHIHIVSAPTSQPKAHHNTPCAHHATPCPNASRTPVVLGLVEQL